MAKPLVLDSSAILTGMDLPPDRDSVAPDGIEREVAKYGGGDRLALLKEAGLRLMRPGEDSRSKIERAAAETGDALKLSRVDIDILALAFELDGEILTDDYAIQNVAKALKIAARGLSERGIQQQWSWVSACSGCGKRFEAVPTGNECPVCGHVVRARRRH